MISTPGASFPPTIELYFVFDIDAKKGGSIVFFKTNGTKTQVGGSAFDLNMTTSPMPGGGTARLVSQGSVAPAPPAYNDTLLYFRGVQKTLVVASGAVDTTRNEPRLMKGIQFGASEFSGNGSFLEGRFKMRYQQQRTVAANNASETLQQSLDALVAELTTKGYNPP